MLMNYLHRKKRAILKSMISDETLLELFLKVS